MKSSFAYTFPNGHEPFPFSAAVHLRGVIGLLLSIIHTHAFHLHQRGELRSCHCVWEGGQILNDRPALLVVDFDGDQGDARPDVLEGEVEPPPGQGTDDAHLRIQLHLPLTQVSLGEALVRRNCINFHILILPQAAANLGICFLVIQVERLLAGTHHTRQAVTIPQGELQLNKNSLGIALLYPVSPKPVVLIGLHDFTDLVCTNGCVVFIQATDLFPLKGNKMH